MCSVMKKTLYSSIYVVLCLGAFGCGKPPEAELPSEDQVANQKVAALKNLAEEMAKDANGAEARAELENFRNVMIDVRKSSKQVNEMNDIYRQKIQGKYKGFVAQELQGEMSAMQSKGKKN